MKLSSQKVKRSIFLTKTLTLLKKTFAKLSSTKFDSFATFYCENNPAKISDCKKLCSWGSLICTETISCQCSFFIPRVRNNCRSSLWKRDFSELAETSLKNFPPQWGLAVISNLDSPWKPQDVFRVYKMRSLRSNGLNV